MSLPVALQEDRRGLILTMLDEAGGSRLAESSIKSILGNSFGHLISTDQLRADLQWLAGQGLVRVDEEPVRLGVLWMVQLLLPGQEVAHGVPFPGIRRQAPKR